MVRNLFGCLVAVLVLTGCTSLQQRLDKFLGVKEGDTAQELAWEGMDEIDMDPDA